MSVAPLESFPVPIDGTVATAANFGKPASDFAASLLGAAAGSPDANNGNPSVGRSFTTGLVGFTNALGIGSYPGAQPASVWDSSAAHSVTVPAGQQLVVCQIALDGTGSGNITLNDGTNTTKVANTGGGGGTVGTARLLMPVWPYVLDQNWIITTPAHSGWLGYYVVRDPNVTPVARAVTSAVPYTVPAGKTLWIFGCVGLDAQQLLETGAGQPIAIGIWNNSGTYLDVGHANGINIPVPLPAGTVVQSDDASNRVSFWGVLL